KGLSHRPRPSSPFSTDGSTVGTHSLGHQRATRPARKPRSQGTTPHRRDAGVDDLPPPPEPPPCQGQGRIQGARSASSMAPPTERKASSLERTPMVRTGWALWTGQMMHAGATNQRMDVCHTTNHHSPPQEATAPLVQPPPRARRGHARPTGHDNHNSGLPRSMLNFLGPMDMENYSDPQGLKKVIRFTSRTPHDDYKIEARDVAWYGGAGVPPWSQAWGRDSSESAWWLGGSSRDPAGPSPNERRKTIPHWAHHLQGEPRGTGAKRIGRRTKVETSAARSPDS
ncbi:hypothetical protein CHARACLAT_023125, partial [Characodon lateralis]|nr:hypothetical protein [Characodon lateralis]